MAVLLMTGFPGFLGSALLPRLLRRRADARLVCLVQARHLAAGLDRLEAVEAEHPDVRGRTSLVTGDITDPDLGLDDAGRRALRGLDEVWHLAAVYDLSVPPDTARRVNVDGTAHVLGLCRSRRRPVRLHHVSTCYVSGRHPGEFPEDGLELGQEFRNHYESTKYDAERLVRAAMADGLPATVYRPGIVVGDSRTGVTQKYDGPYFLATFLRRQPHLAVVPAVGDADAVRVCLVPRDFVVDAMEALSGLDRSVGRTYALTDPDPPTVREVVDTFARHLGRHVLWLPVPLPLTRAVVGSVPGLEALLGLPAEALDYFASPTTYATGHTVADLEGTGVRCPRFATYADRLLDFMEAHPEFHAEAMV